MSICTDGLQVVFVGEIGVRGSVEGAAEDVAHRFYDVLLPQEAVPPARSKVAHPQCWSSAEALHFFPEFRFCAGIEDIEFEFAEALEAGARLQFAEGGKRVNFPHRGVGPKAA